MPGLIKKRKKGVLLRYVVLGSCVFPFRKWQLNKVNRGFGGVTWRTGDFVCPIYDYQCLAS